MMKPLNFSQLFDIKGNISAARLTKYGRDRVVEELKPITQLESSDPVEQIYWFHHDLKNYPKLCKTCNKPITKFHNYKIGYKLNFCCLSCMQQDDSVKQKKIDTMRTTFGEVVSNPSQLSTSNSKKIDSCLKNRGTQWPTQHSDVLSKRVLTYLDRYGVDNPNKSEEFLAKRVRTFSLNGWNEKLKIELESGLLSNLLWDEELGTCTVMLDGAQLECNSARSILARRLLLVTGRSSLENKILSKLQDLKLDMITNSRSVIKPFEIDIYFPDKKVGIEVNGTYWHSSEVVHPNYHLFKTQMAEKAGIKLIHIFEHELTDDRINKTISSIKHSLGCTVETKDARKLEIKQVNKQHERQFMNVAHRQGWVPSKLAIGLFDEEKLIACMTFGKSRFKSEELELLRFACLPGVSVRGGASKLLHHGLRELKKLGYSRLVTYSHLSWGRGFYRKLGFTLKHLSSPGYFYVRGAEVISRMKAQKHKLGKFLSKFDQILTEEQNMKNNGFYKIYDCGCEVFEITF